MARLKRVQVKEQERRVEEEKLDGIFRIFLKTNVMRKKTVIRIELPNNEVHEKNYGNMPQFEVVIPYVGQKLELYLDGKFVGMRLLEEASKDHMKLEEVVE